MTTKVRKTVEDYLALPDDAPRVEMFEGEFYVTPSPKVPHQRIARRIFLALHAHVEHRSLGEVLFAPVDVVLSPEDVVQPDVLFLSNERAKNVGDRVETAPDLAVEILSPGHAERDRIVKRDLYLAHGVDEYWIVDPEAETVEVRVREDEEWTLHGVHGRGDEVASELLSPRTVPSGEIFA